MNGDIRFLYVGHQVIPPCTHQLLPCKLRIALPIQFSYKKPIIVSGLDIDELPLPASVNPLILVYDKIANLALIISGI
jgi:hypothetical protein